MDNNTTQVLIIAAVLVVAYIAYTNCSVNCKKHATESYSNIPLTATASIGHNPLEKIFDKKIRNLDPGVTTKPLSQITYDPYRGPYSPSEEPRVRSAVSFCIDGMDCAMKHSTGDVILNNSKSRRDMIESGDMQLYRQMTNHVTPAHKTYFTNRMYENDMIKPDNTLPALYDNAYHEDAYVGQ
jgi:hypothetical protein